MAKTIFKDKNSFQDTKRRNSGVISYRQTKDGRVIATKWPKNKRKKSLKK